MGSTGRYPNPIVHRPSSIVFRTPIVRPTTQLRDVLHYLVGVGVPAGGALGEDRAAVHVYFKPASIASHEGDALQVVTELVYNLACQPGGACAVVSLLAVIGRAATCTRIRCVRRGQ